MKLKQLKFNKRMNKKAGFTDLFLLMIFGLVIALIVGVFLYIGNMAVTQLHESMDGMDLGDTEGNNASVVIDNTMGQVNATYQVLRWTSILIFFAMIMGIFIGSYLVTTKPIFLVPYIFIVIIAIIVAVGISNAYETIIVNPTMASTFQSMSGMNWILLNYPAIITLTGLAGGLIMFALAGRGGQQYYGGYQ